MTVLEIGAIGVLMVAIVGAIVATHRYNADKRGRIYERLDECKDGFETKVEKDYARKDVCALTHTHVEKELKEIKAQTALIPDIAAQLKVLVNGGDGR
jgi:hypothetical protein